MTVYNCRIDKLTSERFDWTFSFIIESCNETPNTLDEICRVALESPSHLDSAPFMKTAASPHVAKRLWIEDKGRYVTLAFPANPNL